MEQLPTETQMEILSNMSIADLKKIRLVSKQQKAFADKELMRRYNKITRSDIFIKEKETVSNIVQIIGYLTKIEKDIVNPALDEGSNGSVKQREFLTNTLSYLGGRDYYTLRYLLERGADPNNAYADLAEALIHNYNLVSNKHEPQRGERRITHQANIPTPTEFAAMFGISIAYGMNIPKSLHAREILEHLGTVYPVGRVPDWLKPEEWPMFEY